MAIPQKSCDHRAHAQDTSEFIPYLHFQYFMLGCLFDFQWALAVSSPLEQPQHTFEIQILVTAAILFSSDKQPRDDECDGDEDRKSTANEDKGNNVEELPLQRWTTPAAL